MKFLFWILLSGVNASAAVSRQDLDEMIFYSLREPRKHAIQALKNLGPQSSERLKEISFDDRIPMKTRWISFMVYTQMNGIKSLPTVQRALEDSTWFMRSAGLTAMEALDKKQARKWAARILQEDKALLVRMKAIEVLGDAKDETTVELFWKKLNSQDSFHLNKSLWIREDIAKLLMRHPRKKDLQRWIRLLHDKDEKFQTIAALTLGKIVDTKDAVASDLTYWQKRFPAQSLVR